LRKFLAYWVAGFIVIIVLWACLIPLGIFVWLGAAGTPGYKHPQELVQKMFIVYTIVFMVFIAIVPYLIGRIIEWETKHILS